MTRPLEVPGRQNVAKELLVTPHPSDVIAPLAAELAQSWRERKEHLALSAEIMRIRDALERAPSDYARDVIAFVGVPGAGKSTQLELIARVTDAPVFHLGRFARQGPSAGAFEKARSTGRLIAGLDETFLHQIETSDSKWILLDGFPRSPEQAVRLLEMAADRRWQVRIVSLDFPEDEAISLSLHRQFERSLSRGEEPDAARFIGKLARAIEQDLPTIEALSAAGAPLVRIPVDGLDPAGVFRMLRGKLNLSFDALPWDYEVLHAVENSAHECGVSDYWIGCGTFYRTFWNDRFGPVRLSSDIDIGVATDEDAARLLTQLDHDRPTLRVAVKNVIRLAERYGVGPASLDEAQLATPFIWRQGGVRSEGGHLRLVFSDAAIVDLLRGVLRIDEHLLERASAPLRDAILREGAARADKALSQYSALRVRGSLYESYVQHVGLPPVSTRYERSYDSLRTVDLREESSRGGCKRWSGIDASDLEAAALAKTERFKLVPLTTPVPRVELAILPGAMGEMQAAKKRGEELLLPPPSPFASWLHCASQTFADSQWREWLHNQTRSRQPLGGKDAWLSSLLDYSALRPYLPKTALQGEIGAQKPTHQGVPLAVHLLNSALVLETDKLAEMVPSEPISFFGIRGALRLSMLAHDIGKTAGTAGVYTPGVHTLWGERLWMRIAPSWMGEDQVKLAAWCVRNHDLLGRLGRGLVEKEPGHEEDLSAEPTYAGAVDPRFVRDAVRELPFRPEIGFAILQTIWRADVQSVPSLRWIAKWSQSLTDLAMGAELRSKMVTNG